MIQLIIKFKLNYYLIVKSTTKRIVYMKAFELTTHNFFHYFPHLLIEFI